MIFNPPHQNCYACTLFYKAVLAVLYIPVILILAHIGLARGGATYLDVPYLIYSGQLVWWKQAISWACLVVGSVRYMYPGWQALRYNLCLASRKQDELILLGDRKVPIADIVRVSTVSNVIRKGVYIYTRDQQRYYVCTILASATPMRLADTIRKEIRKKGI